MPSSLSLSEQYRQRLRQASWRLQYLTRIRLYHESLPMNEQVSVANKEEPAIQSLLLQEWIHSLPSSQARRVITGLYIEGWSEQELARELQISQQAVNRWKRKSLQLLSQMNNF